MSLRWSSLRAVVAMLALVAQNACSLFMGAEGDPVIEQPSLPYSVLVVGGAVVESDRAAAVSTNPLANTFGDAVGKVLIAESDLAKALRSTRVFTRIEVDQGGDDAALGPRLASLRDGLPVDDPAVAALLDRARRAGHDFVLVLHRVVDGGVEEYGINDRWPLTAATWLLVGLGVLVSDHTYESRAVLEATLFEADEGRLLHRSIGSGAVVELSLLERTDFLGLLQSIVVPPFWVASDGAAIVDSLKAPTIARLLGSMARELKGLTCRRDIAENLGVEIEIMQEQESVVVVVSAREGLASANAVLDGVELRGEIQRDLLSQLLLSQRQESDSRVVARARLPLPSSARILRVLVRTTTGRLVSSTVELSKS